MYNKPKGLFAPFQIQNVCVTNVTYVTNTSIDVKTATLIFSTLDDNFLKKKK